MIKRSKVVEMKYQDADGKEHTTTLDGIGARCVQHEIDHLNGILFLQRASRLKLERALKARPKEAQKRLQYEQRQAFARALQEAQQEKENNESSESTGDQAVSA